MFIKSGLISCSKCQIQIHSPKIPKPQIRSSFWLVTNWHSALDGIQPVTITLHQHLCSTLGKEHTFQMAYINCFLLDETWWIFIHILLKCIPWGVMNRKSSPVLANASCQTGKSPMTKSTGSTGQWQTNTSSAAVFACSYWPFCEMSKMVLKSWINKAILKKIWLI